MASSQTWPIIVEGKGELVARDAKILAETPWVAALLSRPNTIVTPPACEFNGHWNYPTFGSLFNDTLRRPGTFLAYVVLYTDPQPDATAPVSPTPPGPGNCPLQRVSTLVSLGSAMDGWNGVLAGSMAMALMDDAMSALILNNGGLLAGTLPQQPKDRFAAVTGPGACLGQIGMTTGSFQMKFLRPVTTPRVVRTDAWFTEVTDKLRNGRQRFKIEACILDEEENALVKAESIWFTVGEDMMERTKAKV